MHLHHLLIGTDELESSVCFYSEVLGYTLQTTFVDSGTGKKGYVLRKKYAPEILLVPFAKSRLPSPQHLAFEMEEAEFKALFNRCKRMKTPVRTSAELDAHLATEPKEFDYLGRTYLQFYLTDPSQVNLEFLSPKAITIKKLK